MTINKTTERKHVFDTNVIIECFDKNIWKQVGSSLHIETMERCKMEALRESAVDEPSGRLLSSEKAFSKRQKVEIKELDFLEMVKKTNVADERSRKIMALKSPAFAGMNKTEQHILTWVLNDNDAAVFVVSTADVQAIRAACDFDLQDRLICLEQIFEEKLELNRYIPILCISHKRNHLDNAKGALNREREMEQNKIKKAAEKQRQREATQLYESVEKTKKCFVEKQKRGPR